MEELETLSKIQLVPSNKKKYYFKKKTLPDSINANKTFGMKSNFYNNPDEANISDLIKGQFLKDYLEDKVTRNAIKDIINRTLLSISNVNHTKASEMRSKSVAK